MIKIVSSGNTISTTEYLRKKIKARRRRRLIFSLLSLLLLVGAVLVLRLEKLQIKTINISGAVATQPDMVEAVVKDMLSGNYLWFVPHANALLYPRATLENVLLRKFPRFSSVEVSLEGLEAVSVITIERQPFALFCQSDVCYFLDESGFIFDMAPTFSEGVYFIYSAEEVLEAPLGQQFLSVPEFKNLAKFVERVRSIGVPPVQLNLFKEFAELDINLPDNQPAIKWRLGMDLELVWSNLEAFLSSDEIKTQKDFWDKLNILDLTAENKVFYTFRTPHE